MTSLFLICFHACVFLMNNLSIDLHSAAKFQKNVVSVTNSNTKQNKNTFKEVCLQNMQVCLKKIYIKRSQFQKLYIELSVNQYDVNERYMERILRNISSKFQLHEEKEIISIKMITIRCTKDNRFKKIIVGYGFFNKKYQLIKWKKNIYGNIKESQMKIQKYLGKNISKQQVLNGKFKQINSNESPIENEIFLTNIQVQKNQNETEISITKYDNSSPNNKITSLSTNRILQATSQPTSIQYIKNGNFSNTTCTSIYCIYFKPTFQPQSIAYWQPLPELQVGMAWFYHDSRPAGMAVSVSGDHTTCVGQLVQNLPAGLYELRFRYSAQNIFQLRIQSLLVFLNDTQIYRNTPHSYAFIDEVLPNISIPNNNDSVYIKFCGDPNVSSIGGSVLYNVSFKLKTQFPKPNITVNSSSSTTNATNTSSNSTTNTTANTTTNITNTINNFLLNNSSNYSVNLTSNNSNSDTSSTNNSAISNRNQVNNQTLNLTNITSHKKRQYPTFYDLLSQSGLQDSWLDNNQPLNSMSFFGFNLQIPLQINATAIIDTAIQIPLVRQIFQSQFSFFVNLDHLWLYIYHQRDYGVYIKRFLVQIHIFEGKKWNFLSQDVSFFSISKISQRLNQKINQTSKYFTSIENNSRQFLVNTLNFFFFNLPAAIVSFFIAKLLYNVLKKYGYQSILKQFALNSILILIFLQGNTESFVYLLVSDLTMLFSFSFRTRSLNIFVLLFLFTMIFVLISGPFILRSIYERNKKIIFYNKCKNSLKGSVFFMVQFGLFNIMLGSVHILCENRPNFQLFCLLSLEIGFLLYLLANFETKKVYTLIFEIWIIILGCFIRILLIVSYFWFEICQGSMKEMVESVQLTYIILYLSLWIICIFHSMIGQIKEMVQFLYHKITKLCNQLEKQKKQTESLKKKITFQRSQNSQVFGKVPRSQMSGQNNDLLCGTNYNKKQKKIKFKSKFKDNNQNMLKTHKSRRLMQHKTQKSLKYLKIKKNIFLVNEIDVIDQIDNVLGQIGKLKAQLVDIKQKMNRKSKKRIEKL